MSDLFREGGPHQIRRTGPDQFEMSVSIPVDTTGMMGRECPSESCSPAYFKVKPGTGITGDQKIAYCPYCRTGAVPTDFHTSAQTEYAKEVALSEAADGLDDMIREALGLDSGGKKRIGDGFLSFEMSLSPSRPHHVSRPIEEELRRDLLCPSCGLAHAVFGLAFWCPDCGTDLFISHVRSELEVIRHILAAVPQRHQELGARVAARDVENALEDLVSIFEAVLKLIVRRHMQNNAMGHDAIADLLEKKVGTRFQSIPLGRAVFLELTEHQLFADANATDAGKLTSAFEKRHPITHNLGVVDRKYMRRVESGELLGREVRVTAEEILECIEAADRTLARAYDAVVSGAAR